MKKLRNSTRKPKLKFKNPQQDLKDYYTEWCGHKYVNERKYVNFCDWLPVSHPELFEEI